MADARLGGLYDEVIVNTTPTRLLATEYVETLSNSTSPDRRLAAGYVEALANSNDVERRAATSYIEVLSPVPKAFIGWGVPV